MPASVVSMLALAGSVLAVPILVLTAAYFLWPAALLSTFNWLNRWRLGLRVRCVFWGDYRFCYSERGVPGPSPSILLLHGFSANKDMWLPLVKYLPDRLHVVCVDMPGHEGSSRTGPEDYSIEGQVNRIHQFVQAVGLDKQPFQLLGTSMGGNVAGVYAARHPGHLAGLTLICPAGLESPRLSECFRVLKGKKERGEVKLDEIPLVPYTMQQMYEMIRLCCHGKISLPRQVLKGTLALRLPNNDFYLQVFQEITSEQSIRTLHDSLHLITAPLLVIWGLQDEVLDVSGASVLQEAHPDSQVVLLEGCGHAVILQRPRKAAKVFTDFLFAQKVNTKKRS